ncbi:formate dehydrogenase [Methylacidiphilum kamchatkense Kam1]|uniref:Sulfur carrier protein FdhD n=1 Tax=Methylacidiphilum kamchatkense Kam1 TaxID=1202785 RepID=A0A0C1RTQ3_9BACT|nr:formate dehydrogenase accessory sulfurtransferase FdhD [Methylacidiphilum kamchatkense]KIE58356.1 formate dehydrogenase [Methylacidiphilum kamchatkense Kam1]QDQ42239.1 FdhD protein [Methylacidiphilum kamchatkense Kam1]
MMEEQRPGSKVPVQIWEFSDSNKRNRLDYVITEEPLEIRLRAGSEEKTLAVTMRTPGADFDLSLGFIFSEGIVTGLESVHSISYCIRKEIAEAQRYNTLLVTLNQPHLPAMGQFERHFMTSSACGICGRTVVDLLDKKENVSKSSQNHWKISADILYKLPEEFQTRQNLFKTTGGLHAAALFDIEGNLIQIKEDVGRHNAMDKLIGHALREGLIPMDKHIVMVSGRASYELLQKAYMAGLKFFCSVSAPSSLAVLVAKKFSMTLVGFLRKKRFNVYNGIDRIS